MRRVGIIAIAIVAGLPAAIAAQTDTSRAANPARAVFARARQLVVNGNGAAGRLLVDSVLAATSPDSIEYAEALYWRATLAASTADAERDYRHIILEYRFSPRTGDALIQLAQLEMARGDRDAAEGHLRRFLIEQPEHGQRGRAGYLLARLLFDRNETARGCATIMKTRNDVPSDSVELRNQVDYLTPRCEGIDTSGTPAPRPAADSAKETSGRDTATRTAPRPAGRYTIQVAAYQTRDSAAALVKRLNATSSDARVFTAGKVFRVRVGYYTTRAAATTALNRLKARGMRNAFITETADER
jgi:cell division septation protein DedD